MTKFGYEQKSFQSKRTNFVFAVLLILVVFVWALLLSPDHGGLVVVVSNMTPVPREGFRLGVPDGSWSWREALNTDSAFYGGSNLGNGVGPLAVQEQPAQGRARSITLTVPPLATLYLVPC